ncbi:hypothetical protein ACH5BK_03205 [Arcobacter sp. YIC-80]|uniref:hypothetical protein n=1 Tax=Arcobacter sp. YIC-80 TaxID=3376683 RepID=UPI003850C30A
MNKNLLIKIVAFFIPLYLIFGLGYLPSFYAKVMHFRYFFSTPDDYFIKVVDDNKFDFYTKDYSKTYKLNYKYFTLYSIQIEDKNKKISSVFFNSREYQFDGELIVEYFSKDIRISKQVLSSVSRAFYSKNSLEYFSSFELTTFPIPIANKFKDLSIKLTVLKPIKFNSENKLKLSIGATLKE